MRRVTVISTLKSNPVPYDSNATTWGELKDVVARDFGDVSGMKAVVKETRNTLDQDAAVLPEDNFTIFLTQSKIKAGC